MKDECQRAVPPSSFTLHPCVVHEVCPISRALSQKFSWIQMSILYWVREVCPISRALSQTQTAHLLTCSVAVRYL